jgi:hypothetical protein
MGSESVSKSEFETTIKAAIAGRSKRYENVYPLHIRWANDDTYAERAEQSFSSIMKMCGFPSPEVFILKTVGAGKIHDLQKRALVTNATGLLIIHYAGHGIAGEGDGDELVLTPHDN